jgi:hypothetical protein
MKNALSPHPTFRQAVMEIDPDRIASSSRWT